MNLSRTRLVKKLRQRLLFTPLYRPARFLFNAVLLFRAQRTTTIGDISLSFWTPTFKLVDDIEQPPERDILFTFINMLVPGDVVWDVGANVGLYTLFAARRVQPQGKVIAFEPEPRSRTLLLRNCSLNHIENVSAMRYALDKEQTRKTLYPSATPNPGSHSLVQRRDYKLRARGFLIETVRGDSLIRGQGAEVPTVMKIDVEGSEYNVLLGMGDVLRSQHVRILLVEIHPAVLPLFGSSTTEVEGLLTSAKFSRIERIERGGEYHLLCQRN